MNNVFILTFQQRLIVLLDFLTILKIRWKQKSLCMHMQAMNFSVGSCQWSYHGGVPALGLLAADWYAEPWHGRDGLGPPSCAFCMALLTALWSYPRDTRAAILIHKLTCCHQKGITDTSCWVCWYSFPECLVVVVFLIVERLMVILEITVMIFASIAGIKSLCFIVVISWVQPLRFMQ